MTGQQDREKLLTIDFVAVNAIIFLTFCNIALFFHFHSYLGTLPIDPTWFGFLIAVFSFAGLVLRPIISPFLRPDNAGKWVAVGCLLIIVSLLLYHVATDFWSMSLVRVFHGVAYVLMGTAATSKMVGCIPKGRSGQAFGLMGVLTLLPYAVIPPLVKPLMQWMGSFNGVLVLSAAAMLPTFPLLAVMGKGRSEALSASAEPIRFQELLDNLKDRRIASMLILSLLVWTAFAPVFYFLKEYGQQIGVANPGWFLTLSTLTEIGVRLFGGSLLDKANKAKLMAGSLVWLTVGYMAMAIIKGEALFYSTGLFLGLGWGVCMPLLNGLMFDISEPRFRALNTNLSFEMFQAGFVVGPFLGGIILVHYGYGALFYGCAAILATSLASVFCLRRTGR